MQQVCLGLRIYASHVIQIHPMLSSATCLKVTVDVKTQKIQLLKKTEAVICCDT